MFPSPSCSLHGHPSKAWAKPSTLAPAPPTQTNPGLALPRLVAAEGKTHRECCWPWASWEGHRDAEEGSHPAPGRQDAGLSLCRPPPLPTCLCRVAGLMVAVRQRELISYDGALGAGGPIQVGWRDCPGGAGPGLLRGAPSQPRLFPLLRLHLDDLPGALGLAGLPLLRGGRVGDLLCSGVSQGGVRSLQGTRAVGRDPDLSCRTQFPAPCLLLLLSPLLSAMQITPLYTEALPGQQAHWPCW